METIGDKIKRLRKTKGLSLMELASMLDVSDTALSKIETGKTKSITIDLGKGISTALNVSFNDLFNIESTGNASDLSNEIDSLKKRIIELEEQLNDKRRIIDFLSTNDLLHITASRLYKDENPTPKKRDFYDLDALIQEFNERPFDPGDKESLIKYISQRLNEIKSSYKE